MAAMESQGERRGRSRPLNSIVVTARKDSDLVLQDLVDEAVLLVDSAGPAAAEFVLQRFRLPETCKWVA